MEEPGWSPFNNESTVPDGTKRKQQGGSNIHTLDSLVSKRHKGKWSAPRKSAFELTLECPLTYKFSPQFKDKNKEGGREYMCVPIGSEFHTFFESYTDFSHNKRTMDEVVMGIGDRSKEGNLLQLLRPKRETYSSQLFIVKLRKGASTIWNALDDNGCIEMVHLTTGRICQGFYDVGIQHTDPPQTKRGFIIFQVFILTDKSI